MEVLAAVLFFELFLTLGYTIQQDVSLNWDVPEHENVRANQNDPVHDELALLLTSDLGLGAVD